MGREHATPRRARNALIACGLVAAALIAAAACTQNTGEFGSVSHDKPPGNLNVGLGFDPDDGDPLTPPLALELEPESALAGALIPAPGGGAPRRIAFYAFASDAPAADLERANPAPPDDNNGVADVFLAAVADTRIEVGGVPRPAIFAQAMANTFSHPRCVRCHSFHFENGFGAPGTTHSGGPSQLDNSDCMECHDQDIGPDELGQPIDWRAPIEAENGEITFAGKSPFTLCEQIKANEPEILEHFTADSRIFWAFEDALLPTGEVAPGGPAPFRKEDFDDLVAAWVQGDCQCLTGSALRDVALVSHAASGNAAANGASLRPSLAFQHNPDFDPDDPLTTNPAGWLFVAFDSMAGDLRTGFDDNNGLEPDVWRARVAVHADDDGFGVLTPGAIDLVAEPFESELVSASTSGVLSGANGAARAAAIDAGGGRVAFESAATGGAGELVAGFVDGNAAFETDVYLRNLDSNATALVSRSFNNQSGNAPSSGAALSPRGDAVAFETLASDLDFEDVDQELDVYWAEVDTAATAVLALYRASVRTGGVAAGPGESRNASLFVDPLTGRVSVVYESAKADLAASGAGLAARNVYLTRGPEPMVTMLLSQVATLEGAELGNGDSRAPALSPDGRWVVYETDATNLDSVWTADGNAASDVILLDLDAIGSAGHIAGRRLTVAAEGADGNGASSLALIAGVKLGNLADFEALPLCAYTTLATNLGGSSEPLTAAPVTDRTLVFTAED
jgi:hypothetical protein